ncbi:MAG TPA: elongation factor G [Kofleriaceae bacterium]|nr:elongation factor G [Kofleriaceae bacterium]
MKPSVRSHEPRSVPLARTRNIGIMAHVDAGKTTTTERILFYSGATTRIGEVDEGSTVTDWMQQEQERGISITAAATTFGWGTPRHVVNLIDTPGHVDFTMEVERSLRVLDGAIAVFDAVHGVEPQSETVWRQADRYRVPRLAFINKCDREGAEPERVLAEMKARLGATPIPIQAPLYTPKGLHAGGAGLVLETSRASGATFDGVIDLISMRARTWDTASFGAKFTDGPIPPSHMPLTSRAREKMLETIAELDDELMASWVSGRELPSETIRAALRRVTLAGRGVPTFVGAAFKNQGIHNLLDGVLDYLPSPLDLREIRGRDPAEPAGGPTVTRAITEQADDEPLAALAFKVQHDGHGGHLTFVRVYTGVLRVGDAVLDAAKGHNEQIGRLVRMFANHREDIRQLEAGMIGAVVGGKLATGDTLCDPRFPILLDPIAVPSPVMGVVVEPDTAEDHARLLFALERLAFEDPSFHVKTDVESGQVVISGMGELHLEIVVDRLLREFGVRARVGNPQVAYRESVTRRAEGEHRIARTAPGGARGEYGHVQLVIEPTDRGGGYIYENRASAADIPSEHAPAVEAGIAEAVERGILAGHPMTDLRVQVVGGSFHPVDSNHYAFKAAGAKAFVAAAAQAGPILLEPVMSLEVTTPDEHLGDVLGDLHARRGKVAGITARPGVQSVACFVPMATMFGYATDLRSRTKGRATYAMELDHYAELPHQLRDELMSRRARA